MTTWARLTSALCSSNRRYSKMRWNMLTLAAGHNFQPTESNVYAEVHKHYSLGLLVGVGAGLFLGMLFIEAGITSAGESGTRRVIAAIGMIAVAVGGILHAKDSGKPIESPIISAHKSAPGASAWIRKPARSATPT